MFKYQRPTVSEAVGEEDLEEVEDLEEEAREEVVAMEAATGTAEVAEEVEGEVAVVVELRFIAFTSLNLQSTSPRHQFMSPQHQST